MPPIRPEGPHNTVHLTPLFVLAPLLVFFTSNPVRLYQGLQSRPVIFTGYKFNATFYKLCLCLFIPVLRVRLSCIQKKMTGERKPVKHMKDQLDLKGIFLIKKSLDIRYGEYLA